MIYDVHCHLSFPEFDRDRDAVVKKAAEQNVKMINSSVSPQEIPKALEVAEKYGNVYWTLGLSASETNPKKVDDTIEAIKEYKEKIIGLGEVGLDYYWIKDEKLRQKERENLDRFIKLAKELNLPLVIHSRDAEEDCIKMLEEHGAKAMLHCFSGKIEQAQRAIKIGCIISIPTSVMRSKQKQELAAKIPLESIVLETDAPYLSPEPKARNEPVNVKKSAEKIAELRKTSIEEVENKTTLNAKRFFNLK